MPIRIFSDPLFVTVPPLEDRQDVVDWLTSFEAWISEIELLPEAWYCSFDSALILLENDMFPTFDKLRAMQRELHLDINIKRLSSFALKFFQREDRDFRRGCVTQMVLADIKVSPALILSRNIQAVQVRLKEALEIIAISELARHGGVFATLSSSQLTDIPEISFSGTVEAVDPESDNIVPGAEINVTLPMAKSPEGLGAAFSMRAAFRTGPRAVERMIDSIARGRSAAQVVDFKVHRVFLQSADNLGVLSNDGYLEKVVRMCTDVVLDDRDRQNSSYSLRPLRVSKDANALQRKRLSDGASAWRLTVTSSGIGIRAHYWRGSYADGGMFIEFANLLKKGDPEDIPERDI